MMTRWMIISLALLCLTACSGPGVDAYNRGEYAYEHGEYRSAFANYLYAANQGITPAQYALGYQYFYGIGTKTDQASAIMWFKRAAWHSPKAQYALSIIKQNVPQQPWAVNLPR